MGGSERQGRIGTRWRAAAAALCLAAASAVAGAGEAVVPYHEGAALPNDDPALRADADLLLNAVRQRVADCGRGARTLARLDPALLPAGTAFASDATALVERPTLRWNARLASAAGTHARAMARTRRLDHVGVDGRTVRDRVDATGYRWRVVGENLAAGQGTLADAVDDWLASRSHCEALLDARFTEFGLARAVAGRRDDAYGTYWTLVLGRPD